MNTKWISIIFLALSITISGCAASGHTPSTSHLPSIDMQSAKLETALANRYLEEGEPEKAQAAYQLLIDSYPELPIRYKVGLLTNAALASLQIGDENRFTAYARQLETIASGLRPLPRNTQIILAVMEVSGLRNTDSELWITQPVERSVRTALTSK
jgi:hypothetical protein